MVLAGAARGARIGTRWSRKGQCRGGRRYAGGKSGPRSPGTLRACPVREGCDSVRRPDPPQTRAMTDRDLVPLLHRIADALERFAPASAAANDLGAADAFVWHADREWLEPVPAVNRVPIGLLR